MNYVKAILVSGFLAVTTVGCVHTEAETQKKDFENTAEDRLEQMEDRLKKLEVRRDQLLGQPKADLALAVEALKTQLEKTKSELENLESTNASKWLEAKSAVDRELYNLDSAYGKALEVFTKQ